MGWQTRDVSIGKSSDNSEISQNVICYSNLLLIGRKIKEKKVRIIWMNRNFGIFVKNEELDHSEFVGQAFKDN